MATARLVRAPFTIDKNTSGVTYIASDLATSTEYVDVLSYSVPLGMAVEVTPANYLFGQYFNTAGATSGNIISAGTTIVVKKNASNAESRELWKGSNAIFGALGNELERPRFKTGVTVSASEKLVVQVANLGVTLDVSTSNVFIEAVQVYEAI